MEIESTPKLLSCIPCAKRKVRCDRLLPCSHCKRRKGDFCEYPSPSSSSINTQSSDSLLRMHQERIVKLEDHIRRSGGDPSQLSQAEASFSGNRASVTPHVATETAQSSPTAKRTKRSYDDTPITNNITSSSHPQAGLVEHHKQTTYIEAPVWYSWSEARKPGNESHDTQQERRKARQPQNDYPIGYTATLLDQPNSEAKVAFHRRHPSSTEVHALWTTYLTNVHPVVKIFFDWEKEPLMHQAASDPAGLAEGQQALVFAVYFIATLSLSDEQCKAMLNLSTKPSQLNTFQSSVETALHAANYAATSDLLVLQAFVLYLLAIRNRARPAAFFSLLGIAIRIAQRLGLHRDGSHLGLSPMKAEERRRIWWQLQHLEISIGQLVGCVSISLYGDWDTKLPGNLDDDDMRLEMEAMPPDRHGLTSMSHCLWRYFVLYWHRARRESIRGATWITVNDISQGDKEAMMEEYRKPLAEKFLQHCEPLNPLHVHIQIGIQSLFLAFQRSARQPDIASSKMSEMPKSDRDEFLKICTKCMDYYMLAETTPSIAHLRWHTESYFQWTAFVYIVIEAHHRATTSEALTLWTLIDRVCQVHAKLTTAVECPEVSTIGRLIVLAWQQREQHLKEQQGHIEKPWCVGELEEALGLNAPASDANGSSLMAGMDDFGSGLDFEFINWSFWETSGVSM